MNPDVTNITNAFNFFREDGILLIFKVLVLLLLFIFILFNFIVLNRVSTLNKTFYLTAARASATIYAAALILLLASISLFVITIVIV